MSTLVPYAAQIIPHTRRTGAQNFIYCYERGSEIHTDQANAATTVYALIEALGNPKTGDQASEAITSQLDRLFVAPTDQDRLAPSFEQVVSDINHQLKDLADAPQLNAVIACIQGEKIAVVHTGKAEAHMGRGRNFLRITESLPQTTPNKRQAIFSEVADGKLKNGDRIILVTPGLLHHVSIDQLKNSLLDNAPASCAEKLAQMVDGKLDANRSSAVIIEIAAPQYLAEFAGGGQTTIFDISAKESFIEVAKQSSKPIIKSFGHKTSRAAKHFGSWTANTAWPATKQAASTTYNKIRATKSGHKPSK